LTYTWANAMKEAEMGQTRNRASLLGQLGTRLDAGRGLSARAYRYSPSR